MPVAMKRAKVDAMAGIIDLASIAGRPGPWVDMPRSEVEELVESGGGVLTVLKHKTLRTSGALGKYVPAGSLTAMRTFLSLPHLTERFKENAVDGALLAELSAEELVQELGLTKI